MTPLDDELRRTLSTRAATVAPAADPLEGIESRARGMRRRRTAVSLVGAVAAVAAVAIAVPSLTSDGGQELQLGTSPTTAPPSSSPTVAPPVTSTRPANVLDWPARGDSPDDASVHDLGVAFTRAMGRSDGTPVGYQPLFTAETEGVRYTTGQAWFAGGDKAYAVSYAVGPDNVPQFFVGPATAPDPWGLAFLISGFGNTDHDLLVVVPRPGVGQVSYDDNASGAFRPAEMESALGGVALIPRDLQASKDRLEVLDGNGDLDNPMYRGAVTPLLCGLKECG